MNHPRSKLRGINPDEIKGFTAEVMARNASMMEVLSKRGHPLITHLESGVYELEIPFSGEEKEKVYEYV
jgi:hypothetical protein